MKRRYNSIAENLSNLLDKELLEDVGTFRERRLSQIHQIIRKLSADLSEARGTKNTLRAIQSVIEELRAFSPFDAYKGIISQLIADVSSLKQELPRLRIYPQHNDRFRIFREDSWYVKSGKMGKQLLRWAGKSEWKQKIPLQNVLVYHLLDAQWFFKQVLAAEEHLRMRLILELNQVLTGYVQNERPKNDVTALLQLLKVLKNQAEETTEIYHQQLAQARNQFIEEFMEIYDKVGTFERPAGFYSNDKLLQKRTQIQNELEEYLNNWHEVNTQLLEQTSALVQFLAFFDDVQQRTVKFEKQIQQHFNETFSTAYEQMQNQLAAVRNQLDIPGNEMPPQLVERCHELLESVDSHLLSSLHKSVEKNSIQRCLGRYTNNLKQRIYELDETITLTTLAKQNSDPPRVQTRTIPWQEVVSQIFTEKLLGRITSSEYVEEFYSAQLNKINEIGRIIKVNLKSVSGLDEEELTRENPRQILEDALQQVDRKVKNARRQTHEAERALLDPLQPGMREVKNAVLDLLGNTRAAKPKKVKKRPSGAESTSFEIIRKRQKDFQKKMRDQWSRAREGGMVLGRFARQKSRRYFRRSRRWFEAREETPQQADSEQTLAAYLQETRQRINNLPYPYRKQFDADGEPDTADYLKIDEGLRSAREAYERWENGQRANLAMVGEKGSGKTCCIDMINSEVLYGQRVAHLSLQENRWTAEGLAAIFNGHFDEADFSSVESLPAFFTSTQGRCVIIIEDIQHLYLRSLNGYEAIEQLMHLIGETSDQVFWITSCSRYAWAFLDKAFFVSDYFSHHVETDDLDKEQIEELILRRHRASGYQPVFSSTERPVQKQNQPPPEEGQQKQQEKYFEQLATYADGNASVAMGYWMRSIQRFDEDYCYIAAPEKAPAQELERLAPEGLFALAALVLHGPLEADALALTQAMQKREARLMLNRLARLGLIHRTEWAFQINPLIYREVVELLKARNILHF